MSSPAVTLRVCRLSVEKLVDDLDGSSATHTVRIGWENEWREIDLSDKNFASLSKGFDRFWDAARPVADSSARPRRGRAKTGSRTGNGADSDYDRQQFKTWAVANDVKLNRRRPPRDIVERFLASQR